MALSQNLESPDQVGGALASNGDTSILQCGVGVNQVNDSREDRLVFLVQGSKGDDYTVTFIRNGLRAHAFCTCQAGQNGQYCNHRISLLDGDVSSLVSENVEDMERLKLLIAGSDLESAYRAMCAATSTFDNAKNDLYKAKRVLAKAMYR